VQFFILASLISGGIKEHCLAFSAVVIRACNGLVACFHVAWELLGVITRDEFFSIGTLFLSTNHFALSFVVAIHVPVACQSCEGRVGRIETIFPDSAL
jgi:hypothetical protein